MADSLIVCTAYELGTKSNRLLARVKSSVVDILCSLGETRIVRPTLAAPVIMPDGELKEMSWGFRRKFRGKKGPVSRTIVNSREDKLDSAMWRKAFRERRCLIPAIAFYEWVEGAGGKAVPLRFTRQDDGWILIAGIWEEGEGGPCFSMLTTEPSSWLQGFCFLREAPERAIGSDRSLGNGGVRGLGSPGGQRQLSHLFKRRTGITPRDFRRRQGGGHSGD